MSLTKYTDFAAKAMNDFFGVDLVYVADGQETTVRGTIKLGPNELLPAGNVGVGVQPAVIRIRVADMPVTVPDRAHRIRYDGKIYQPLNVPGIGCYEKNESWYTIYTKETRS